MLNYWQPSYSHFREALHLALFDIILSTPNNDAVAIESLKEAKNGDRKQNPTNRHQMKNTNILHHFSI
jgi:hypothetical protein